MPPFMGSLYFKLVMLSLTTLGLSRHTAPGRAGSGVKGARVWRSSQTLDAASGTSTLEWERSGAPYRVASFLAETVLTSPTKARVNLCGGARPHDPSLRSSNCDHDSFIPSPRSSGRPAAHSSGRLPCRHSMTRAHRHTALPSCAYVWSSRSIQYNLVASLRATATLARARCLRIASRR